jgi:hypothetical protein
MHNEDSFKARSIELAERLYRQKARAQETEEKIRLDDAADELIKVDNPNRFYTAQSKLEISSLWSEEQRALAHEISALDLGQRDIAPLQFPFVIQTLEGWVSFYAASPNEGTQEVGKTLYQALQELTAGQKTTVYKQALNYLLNLFEVLLTHSAAEAKAINTNLIDPSVILLRNMRDTTLVARELLVDDVELLDADNQENGQFGQVSAARETLQEIYATVKPVALP